MSSFDSFLDDSIHSIIPASIPLEVPISPKIEKLKRPPNAYNLFFMEQQAKVKLENPSLSGNQVSQELGRRWKEMSEESKKPYIDRANDIRDRFKQENPDYHYEKKKAKKHKCTTQTINDNNDSRISDVFSCIIKLSVSQYLYQDKHAIESINSSVDSDLLPILLQNYQTKK